MKKRRERYSRILSDAKNAHERCEYDEFKDDIRDVDIYNLVYKIKRWIILSIKLRDGMISHTTKTVKLS